MEQNPCEMHFRFRCYRTPQRFFGHESITTTRLYAETTADTLQRRFDQLTDPAAHALVAGIRQK